MSNKIIIIKIIVIITFVTKTWIQFKAKQFGSNL